MKNTLLITASVAALVVGIGLASAQGLNERRDAPAATTSDQKAPQGDCSQEKSALPQKTEKMTKPAPTAQTQDKREAGPDRADAGEGQAGSDRADGGEGEAGPTAKDQPGEGQAGPDRAGAGEGQAVPTAQTQRRAVADQPKVGQAPNQGTARAEKGSKDFAVGAHVA